MAEAFNSLFKAECICTPRLRPNGGWKPIRDVEIATAEYIDWFNHRRLHGELGQIPPAGLETNRRSPADEQTYADQASPAGDAQHQHPRGREEPEDGDHLQEPRLLWATGSPVEFPEPIRRRTEGAPTGPALSLT